MLSQQSILSFLLFLIYLSPYLCLSLPDNMSHLQQFRIPDLHADVPLKDSTNPHYRAAAAKSRAWINSFHIFKNRKRVDFIQGLNELLCSHVYCFAGYEQFRTTCDFVSLGASWLLNCAMVFSLLFCHRTLGQCVVCGGRDQRRPKWQGCKSYLPQFRWDHEEPWVWWRFRRCQDHKRVSSVLIVSHYSLNGTNEMYSFRARFVQLAGPNNLHRFVKLCGEYTRCVTREAELREAGEVLSMQEYIPLRRNNSAVLLCLALNEYILGIDLPQDIYENPVFMKAYWAACDHVCWANVSFWTQKKLVMMLTYTPPSGCLFLQHGTVERPYRQ